MNMIMTILVIVCFFFIMVLIALIDHFAEDLIRAETTKWKIECKNKIITCATLILALILSVITIMVFWT